LILLTLGTHEQPFDRALEMIVLVSAFEDVVVQHGHTPPRPIPGARMVEFARPGELGELMDAASAVVCHAGVGSIMTTIAHGHTPVVIPRLRRYGEHVDDHQLQIAEEFELEGMVIAVRDGDDLAGAVWRARELPRREREESSDLRHAVVRAAGLTV
jgi:UDP-N-acetylglucosamine transferase subunit ALG13